jgi:ADP-ribose pyrophosphatase
MASDRESLLPERLVEREVVRQGNYMTFVHDTIADAEGRQHAREMVIHPGAVCIVALLPDRRLPMVRQYRHAAGEVLLELPAGTLDREPDGSLEDPAHAARRELSEETGYRAAQWRKLAEFFTTPGFATELMHLYLATELEPDPDYGGPMDDERLELVVLSLDEALERARAGAVRDAKSLLGLYLVDRLVRAGEVDGLTAS